MTSLSAFRLASVINALPSEWRRRFKRCTCTGNELPCVVRGFCGAGLFKDVRDHCYYAFSLRTLFIRHARVTSYIKGAHRVKNINKM